MRDDPEYWDALSSRIVETIRERRSAPWLRIAIWAPPLATAAALTLLLASGRAPATAANRAPSIAAMLTAQSQAPSIVTMMSGRP
jgi:anti-sigma-K factor RskA